MTPNPVLDITPVQRTLIGLLAEQVFHAAPQPDLVCDWEELLKEAEGQSVYVLACEAAQDRMPAQIAAAVRPRLWKYFSQNLNVINAHYEIHDLLTGAGIPYVVMKGCVSAAYYPEPELRVMGDVDIYVKRETIEAVRALLEENGYSGSGFEHPNHWSFGKDGVELEVHWVPSGVPAADDGRILACFDDLLEQSRPVEKDGRRLVLPSAFHHGLIMLLHTANHMTAGGIGLRHLMDWLVFENSYPEQEFRAVFESVLRQLGLWRFAAVLTAVGVQFFSCEERSFCQDVSPELAEGLLRDILAGGNFGVKDADRLNQSKLLRDIESRKIDGGSGLRHLMGFLNQRARARLPAAKKCPLLLPVGWVMVLRSRSEAVRRGKQSSLHLQQTLKGARERGALYEQLELFEAEE